MDFLAIQACQDSEAKKNINDFCFKKSSSSKKLSTENLIKEETYVVMEKNEFQHSAKSKFTFIYI